MATDVGSSALMTWASQQLTGAFSLRHILIGHVRLLPDLSDWTPNEGGLVVLHILSLGVALGRIDDPSFRPLLSSVSASLREFDRADRDDQAELYAAALVRPWCDTLTYVKPIPGQRTPDLVATVDGKRVEIEVTIANEKDEHVLRKSIASSLQAKLCALPIRKHLNVYFLDSLSADEEREIIRVATEIDIDTFAEVEHRWCIYASGANTSGVFAVSRLPPAWFPEQPATPASLQATIAMGDGQAERGPSAEVRWGLSTKSYINPLSKKAERHQGSGNSPFLIALDITALPGAAEWYEQALIGYWDMWPNVSGVLLFRSATIGFDAFSITYKLLPNPQAKYLLPSVLLTNASAGEWKEPFFDSLT